MIIKDVKVWHGRHTKKGQEARIYVHTTDGREGCLYLTGNLPWNAKGSKTGNLTEAEWQRARDIAVWDKKWHTVYENEMPTQTNCPDCGGDCGANCEANAPLHESQIVSQDHGLMKLEETGTV